MAIKALESGTLGRKYKVLKSIFRIQICFISATRIRICFMKRIRKWIQVAKNHGKSWKISTKINQNHKKYIYFFKIFNFWLTDIHIYLINNKTNHFFVEKYIFDRFFYKVGIFSIFADPDQIETDPLKRHIDMTGSNKVPTLDKCPLD